MVDMFKLLSGIAIAAILIALTPASHAQQPPASPTATPQAQPVQKPSASPTVTPQAQPAQQSSPATTPDLELLSKALGVFWKTDRAETESQMTIDAGSDGVNVKMYARIKTIAQTGNKFATQLVFTSPEGKITATYQIVSNGKKVWIYRPERRQYAEITTANFNNGADSFWIGTPSFLFMSISEADRRETMNNLAGNNNILTSLLKGQTADLQGIKRKFDGEELYNYTYENRTENWIFNGSVQPQTAALKQIEIAGKSNGVTFAIADKIISRNSNPTIFRKTFMFSPPKGVKKVKSLEIDPFNLK
jgi:outer membrane lipoprotein-sorting protein